MRGREAPLEVHVLDLALVEHGFQFTGTKLVVVHVVIDGAESLFQVLLPHLQRRGRGRRRAAGGVLGRQHGRLGHGWQRNSSEFCHGHGAQGGGSLTLLLLL